MDATGMTDEQLVEALEQRIVERHRALVVDGDARRANACSEDIEDIVREVRRRGAAAEVMVVPLLRHDDDVVRRAVAAYALAFARAEAEAVLEEFAAGPPTLQRFEAVEILKQWRAGALQLPLPEQGPDAPARAGDRSSEGARPSRAGRPRSVFRRATNRPAARPVEDGRLHLLVEAAAAEIDRIAGSFARDAAESQNAPGSDASPAEGSELESLLRRAATEAVFHVFALVDGVADPDDADSGDAWLPMVLCEPPDEEDPSVMLHDLFSDASAARG